MKIAVQIFGHLRTYKQCYKSLFEHLLNHYDCDVFIHTWDKIDHNTQTWHDYHMPDVELETQSLINDIKNTYHPIDLMVETQNVVDMGTITADNKQISVFGMYSMLYSMSMANKLRTEYQQKHKIKYDLVVVVRPDVLLNTDLILESFIQPEDKNSDVLYTVGNYKRNSKILNDFRFVGGTDLCFFSNPNVISKIYENTDSIMAQIKKAETSYYGPEYSFVYAIEKLKIHVLLINYLWFKQFIILRPGNKPDTKPIPKWLWHIICLFIPKRKNRHNFKNKYVQL